MLKCFLFLIIWSILGYILNNYNKLEGIIATCWKTVFVISLLYFIFSLSIYLLIMCAIGYAVYYIWNKVKK